MISAVSRLGGEESVEALRRGATICAATQRLARALEQAWTEVMLDEGRKVWRTPDILPFTAWQRRMAAMLSTRFTARGKPQLPLLEQQQELLTWEQAALASGILSEALQPLQLAGAMMDAHAVMLNWDIHIDAGSVAAGSDTAAFLSVLEHARLRWQQIGAAPAAMLPWRAIEAIRTLPHSLPAEVLFIGFDLPPDAALRETLRLLGDSGVVVKKVLPDRDPGSAQLYRYLSFEEELHAAAQWCASLLNKGQSDIGIIVPNLDNVRTLVERVFTDVLHSATTMQVQDGTAKHFELSLGPRAVNEPLIDAAFLLLETQRGSVPVEQWTRILHSPFLKGADRWGDARALIDAELRRRGMREAAPQDICHAATRVAGADGDPLLKVLEALSVERGRLSAAEWTIAFLGLLEDFGWPGDRGMNSREFQARERFRELLSEFSGLDAVMAPVSGTEALSRFRRLAGERVFQVKSVNAPVQIMGVRESGGLCFSHCRVLGMNDDLWPPSPQPTPFIPLHLQRAAGVTTALPERFLEQVREETALLGRTADEVIFTCSRTDGDRELLPTPMLGELVCEDCLGERRDAVSAIVASDRSKLESCSDNSAPPVDAEETVRGGTRVISLQSTCPFQAFASLRLHAAKPEHIEHGVRSIDRGNLLHRAMEYFWAELKTQARLVAMSGDDLSALLTEVVDKAIVNQRNLGLRRVPEHLMAAERQCMLLILDEWVEVEKLRQPFVVTNREEAREIALAGLSLRMQADRIDELPDGSKVMIDYKSGKKTQDDWMSERPAEPQIPLYVQTMDADLRAAAFAMLRRGEAKYVGLRDDDVPMNELVPASKYLEKREMEERNWPELRAHWVEILNALASDFVSGVADVDPRQGAATCQWCALASFCRINDVTDLYGRDTPEQDGGDEHE